MTANKQGAARNTAEPTWKTRQAARRQVLKVGRPVEPGAAPDPKVDAAAASALTDAIDGPQATRPRGKLGVLVSLLQRPEGAGIDDLITATGWQAHSVRGVISGALKKKLNLQVSSSPTDAGRVYRIVPTKDA